ncbi:glycosyltransferase [Amycolatopsis sp. SID8362]|uniref:glycosyltransferase n=1 Tax=Amycolatopsis sp. SID8362 TaxID=2690346 RepID=UPI00136DFD15|nr:glycosyltransferase [Amycolatopsis sp. SID8362]NBH06641.1 glycosyltransferase [Amycolatopsis sp. SID8362]NED43338.1 glycosyltransferase family 1 protein [Amycolatopsis sp. SID8362]
MSRPRRPILFVSSPDRGLINPLLVLAKELSRRGVPDLYFATSDNRRAEVEAIGADGTGTRVGFRSLGAPIPELSSGSWDDETYRAVTQESRWKAHKALLRHTFDTRFRDGTYRALATVTDEVEPALMVVDSLLHAGFELAVTRGIPHVVSAPFPPSNAMTKLPKGFPVPHSGLPLEMTAKQRRANTLFGVKRKAFYVTDALMRKRIVEYSQSNKELGVSKLASKYSSRIDEAAAVFVYSLAELDYPVDIPEHFRLLGAILPPLPEVPAEQEVRGWLDRHESVVYLGFGTVARLDEEEVGNVVEVARRLEGKHAVLWRLPAESWHLLPPADTLPANLRTEKWLPSQLDVLAHPHVRAHFTHGGGNGFIESLYFGKPLLLRPLFVDCYDQAVRGRDTGVGLVVERAHGIDVDDVTAKLTEVLENPSFTARAREMARLQREPGRGREGAADLLLSLAEVEPASTAR